MLLKNVLFRLVIEERVVYDSYNEKVCLDDSTDGLIGEWKPCTGDDGVEAPAGLDSAIAVAQYTI